MYGGMRLRRRGITPQRSPASTMAARTAKVTCGAVALGASLKGTLPPLSRPPQGESEADKDDEAGESIREHEG